MVAAPFFFLLLAILQVGVYYMTQSALDAGVIRTADALRTSFTTGTTFTAPSAATVKSNVVTNAGGLVHNDSTLAVDVRQVSNLSAAAVPITDGTADFGTSNSALALRAQASVISFAPYFGQLLKARSSAIVRRQGT